MGQIVVGRPERIGIAVHGELRLVIGKMAVVEHLSRRIVSRGDVLAPRQIVRQRRGRGRDYRQSRFGINPPLVMPLQWFDRAIGIELQRQPDVPHGFHPAIQIVNVVRVLAAADRKFARALRVIRVPRAPRAQQPVLRPRAAHGFGHAVVLRIGLRAGGKRRDQIINAVAFEQHRRFAILPLEKRGDFGINFQVIIRKPVNFHIRIQ